MIYLKPFDVAGDNIIGVMKHYYNLEEPVSTWDLESIKLGGVKNQSECTDLEIPGAEPFVEIWINAKEECHPVGQSLRIIINPAGTLWGILDYETSGLLDLDALDPDGEYTNVKLSVNDRHKIMPYVQKYLAWMGNQIGGV